jgi:hypothetical protein
MAAQCDPEGHPGPAGGSVTDRNGGLDQLQAEQVI